MAGSGVNPESAQALIESGIDCLHFSVHDKNLSPSDPGYILKDKIEGILNRL